MFYHVTVLSISQTFTNPLSIIYPLIHCSIIYYFYIYSIIYYLITLSDSFSLFPCCKRGLQQLHFYKSVHVRPSQGLEVSWSKHRRNAELLWEGLEKLGLELFVKDKVGMATL